MIVLRAVDERAVAEASVSVRYNAAHQHWDESEETLQANVRPHDVKLLHARWRHGGHPSHKRRVGWYKIMTMLFIWLL